MKLKFTSYRWMLCLSLKVRQWASRAWLWTEMKQAVQVPIVHLSKLTSVWIKVGTDIKSHVQCIWGEDAAHILKAEYAAHILNVFFYTNIGEICFVCPLNVEVLLEYVINSRLAKVLELLWSLTYIHYTFYDL